MRTYEGKEVRVTGYRRGGYWILRVQRRKTFYAATKNSKEAHVESGWMPPQEIKFERAEVANRYFKAIKKNNPDLRMVSDEPNKYISYTGEVKEF